MSYKNSKLTHFQKHASIEVLDFLKKVVYKEKYEESRNERV